MYKKEDITTEMINSMIEQYYYYCRGIPYIARTHKVSRRIVREILEEKGLLGKQSAKFVPTYIVHSDGSYTLKTGD